MKRVFLLLSAAILLFPCPARAAASGEAFFALVASGDVAGVEAALAEGMDVESRNREGETPLIVAAKNRSLPMTELLLRSGADVDARRYGGGTALHYAVAYGAPEIVRALIRAGADIEADGGGHTPIFLTALFKKSVDPACNLRNLRILLEAGARIDVTDETGATPLIYAGVLAFGLYPKEEVELIRMMLAAGAKLNAEDDYGTTALTAWSTAGSPESVKFLQSMGAKGDAHAGLKMKAANLLPDAFEWKIFGIPVVWCVLFLLAIPLSLRNTLRRRKKLREKYPNNPRFR